MKKLSSILNLLKRETSSGNYIPLVDGIRFLAIALVLFQHLNERMVKYNSVLLINEGMEEKLSFLISRGTVGVFIFFCLSGFIIALPFLKNQVSEGINYKSYIWRRITRLEPTYVLWMLVFFLILSLKEEWTIGNLKHFFASIFYSHNIMYTEYSTINPVAWSLEVEIQFYLIAPFLIVALLQIADLHKRLIAQAFLIFIFILIQFQLNWFEEPFRASILGQLPHFILGIMLADLYVNSDYIKNKSVFWDIVFIPALLLVQFNWKQELASSLIMETSMLMLFLSMFKGRFISILLSQKLIITIGGMCYTIYLIHLPLLEAISTVFYYFVEIRNYYSNLILMALLAIPIILGMSVPAFYFLEKPFMRSKW